MFNLTGIMKRAWEIKRAGGERRTMATALRLAWAEAKGEKRYVYGLENARASISSYLMRLARQERDEHAEHKL